MTTLTTHKSSELMTPDPFHRKVKGRLRQTTLWPSSIEIETPTILIDSNKGRSLQ